MFLDVFGYSNSTVTNNTVSLAYVTITGNTASGGSSCWGPLASACFRSELDLIARPEWRHLMTQVPARLCDVCMEHTGYGGGMYLQLSGESNSMVSSNTVSLAYVTISGNTASGGECVVGDHRPVVDPSRT